MTTIECDGCEEKCINKPVVVYPAQEDKPGRAFVVCDERDGMGRIRVSFDRMRQWQTTCDLIADVVARLLGASASASTASISRQWHLGVLKGKKHKSRVTLLADGGLSLAFAGHTVPIVEVLAIKNEALALDKGELIRLVDKPASDVEPEIPEQRRDRLRARVREERATGTRAFLRRVAEEEGISVSRLKQLTSAEPSSTNMWSGLSTVQKNGDSLKKIKPKR
ncbi:MAG: hypothetical protein PHF15_10065 [Rhodoferax sp.]|nr:hypothetical protein [Rhodoferax sp.]